MPKIMCDCPDATFKMLEYIAAKNKCTIAKVLNHSLMLEKWADSAIEKGSIIARLDKNGNLYNLENLTDYS